eukprot:scaffold14591_cov140-Isochrysis_galbana.AAC.8
MGGGEEREAHPSSSIHLGCIPRGGAHRARGARPLCTHGTGHPTCAMQASSLVPDQPPLARLHHAVSTAFPHPFPCTTGRWTCPVSPSTRPPPPASSW